MNCPVKYSFHNHFTFPKTRESDFFLIKLNYIYIYIYIFFLHCLLYR